MTDKELLHPDVLRKLLRYDPETGKLYWLARDREFCDSLRSWNGWNTRYPGTEAFTADSGHGYKVGAIFGVKYYAHRVIFAMQNGYWPDTEIDHIDRNRSNNKLENMRQATTSGNSANRVSKPGSSSKFLGVCWNKRRQRWAAQISKNGKTVLLGHFASEREAAQAYDRASLIKHGRYANPNFSA
jgi:hypothetical protein